MNANMNAYLIKHNILTDYMQYKAYNQEKSNKTCKSYKENTKSESKIGQYSGGEAIASSPKCDSAMPLCKEVTSL